MEAPVVKSQSALARVAPIVFVLSGASALMFETVWFRVTSIVLGSSVWSAAAVLMAFMSGLALGNLALALRGERIGNPARLYIVIEVVIGLAGAATVFYLPMLSGAIASLLSEVTDQRPLLNAARFGIAFGVLLLPAIGMGATLPVMQKALREIDRSFSYSIARLYGWNTFGAVCGTLIAEFGLIGLLGLKATGLAACGLNLFAALLMLRFADGAKPLLLPPQEKAGSIAGKRLLAGPALAGFFLLALEVVWFRFLTIFHFETSTLFAIMLAVVLVGIALGGLIVARTGLAERDVDRTLFTLGLAAALALVLSLLIFQWIAGIYFTQLSRNLWIFAAAAVVLMLPTSVVSGMLFPIFGERLHRRFPLDTQASGLLTFANTLGAAIGSGVATFLLLPRLGIEYSILAIAFGYLALGGLILATRESGAHIARAGPKFAVSLLIVATIFPYGALNRALERLGQAFYPDEELVVVRESAYATLHYYRHETLGQPDFFRLATNGFSMTASNFHSERYMKLFAYLPEILHRNLQDVLLISYGVGNTADAITQLDSVRHVDVVDISPDVIELSRMIDATRGSSPLDDPRIDVHIEDGRFFLQTVPRKYDLITGEPPPPKNPLIVNLYSREYFALMRERLKPGGIASYWLPIHALLGSDSAAIISAFCGVFEDCSLWSGYNQDFILLGSNGGFQPLSRTQLNSYWSGPLATELFDIGIENPGMLSSLFMADHETLVRLVDDTPPLTDNYPLRLTTSIDGIFDPSPFHARLLNVDKRRSRFESSEFVRTILPAEVIAESVPYFELEKVYLLGVTNPHVDFQRPYIWEALTVILTQTHLETLPLYLLGSTPRQLAILDASDDVASLEYQRIKSRQLLVRRDYAAAAALLQEITERGNDAHSSLDARLLLVARALAGETFPSDAIEAHPQIAADPMFRQWFTARFRQSIEVAQN
jgi:spermidine synthase